MTDRRAALKIAAAWWPLSAAAAAVGIAVVALLYVLQLIAGAAATVLEIGGRAHG